MIKNIIFDFGDVFINLDKEVVIRAFTSAGGHLELLDQINHINEKYEVGAISSETFINQLHQVFPAVETSEIKRLWNGMLLDFPDHRLQFIEALAQSGTHRLFLLSNTNALHISHLETIMGMEKLNRFKNSFEQFYLSHEIRLRKPNVEIYEFVLDQNALLAEETLFIDDTKQNTDAAAQLGINTWHLKVGIEDVTELISRL